MNNQVTHLNKALVRGGHPCTIPNGSIRDMTQAQHGESESCIVALRSFIYKTELDELKKRKRMRLKKSETLDIKTSTITFRVGPRVSS
jgi:hypothetical protein